MADCKECPRYTGQTTCETGEYGCWQDMLTALQEISQLVADAYDTTHNMLDAHDIDNILTETYESR